nr:MAG TPA: hypothetical protein [Caudoviricetes sp.]
MYTNLCANDTKPIDTRLRMCYTIITKTKHTKTKTEGKDYE